MRWLPLALDLVWRALKNPSLARDLLRVAWRFRRRGWMRRFPFLPLPAYDYLRWRMLTVYGAPDAVPPVDDIVKYARWAAARSP